MIQLSSSKGYLIPPLFFIFHFLLSSRSGKHVPVLPAVCLCKNGVKKAEVSRNLSRFSLQIENNSGIIVPQIEGAGFRMRLPGRLWRK